MTLAMLSTNVSAESSAPAPAVASPVECKAIAEATRVIGPMKILTGSYGANCDWKKLGAYISLTEDKTGSITSFGHLTYAPDGLHANFQTGSSFYGTDGHYVGGRSYLCTLQKQHKSDKNWTPIDCELRAISDIRTSAILIHVPRGKLPARHFRVTAPGH